ncbi:putative receptor-like protein kinase At3g47110 [Papaver somniferum]|uniref:putative receptor-like protein kinase At3g47110 n=1 Tax=Papaver somniferum TaxID=3469 RepID=UPI000E6FE705|nr:putative receptor-like protein kinase At3g47110 [Papaver somniferum]
MSFLLIICIVTFSMNFSPAFQSELTNGNETDRLALLEFHSKLTYDPYGALGSWNNNSDHCSWIGIQCNLESPRRVTSLDLSDHALRFKTSIPPDIGNITFLMTLRLGDNGFYGEIPQQIGRLLRLENLDLSGNYLSGEIPSSLKNCHFLKGLYLTRNYLEEMIPRSLQSLKGIEELNLSHNHLSGPVPEYLKSFPFLEILDLSWNNFEGEVPKEGIFNDTSAFFYDGNFELCGGHPSLQLNSFPRNISKKLMLILILSGALICAIILGFFVKFFSRRRARIKPSSSEYPVSDMLQKVSYKPSSSESPFSDMFHKVSYKELLRATDGFSSKNLAGVGGYGSVYVGILTLSQEITAAVAVKVIDLQKRGALKSFKAECEASRCIRHRNIMKILTSCSSVDFKGNEFKALLYEFMPNGSLQDWLHPTANHRQHWKKNRPFKFIERLNISIDVASALDYLHRQCQTPIAHCDLKPSNILLDEDMNGHLGDFGSAKFLRDIIVNVDCSSSFGIRGSIGYVAPEYGIGTEVSTNGDFYSFGIMLLELFTGKRPTANMFKDGLTLHSFAKTALIADRIIQIVDHTLVLLQNGERKAKFCKALTEIIKLGVTCSIESPKERMEMELVVKELQSIKNVYLS